MNDNPDRDQQIMRRLANIEKDLNLIKQSDELTMKANREYYYKLIDQLFGGVRRAQIYLLLDGERSTRYIANFFNLEKTSNIVRELKALENYGFVRMVKRSLWVKTKMDSILDISKYVKKKHKLNNDATEKE